MIPRSRSVPLPPCDVLAAKLRITGALELRVLAQEYQGHCDVHIREFALNNGDVFVATPRGVSVRAERLSEILDGVRELREAGENEGVVSTIDLPGGRSVVFSIVHWSGTTKADIRNHYVDKRTLESYPTKRGTRFSLALLPELERALEALDRALGE